MPHAYRHYADGEYIYFVTWAVLDWIPLFISARYCDVFAAALSYCRRERGLRLHAYVIMPNHVHLICSSEPSRMLPGIIRDIKRYTSRELTRCLEEDHREFILAWMAEAARVDGKGNDYRLWRKGYHPEAIVTQKFFRQKLDYLHENPVRKGLVRRSEDWAYSSAYDYATGLTGILEIDRLAL